MYLKILAFDLDGTLTETDEIGEEVKVTLQNAHSEGFTIILVTGRRLKVIPDITFFEDICEAIVAENGAAIFFPRNDSVSLPFGELAPDVKKQLLALNIPIEVGMAIAATWVPHDKVVIDVLSKTEYAATVEYNKGAVMILPPGATKGTGLRMALHELGCSPHNVVAFGDAQNDRSLFEQVELSVAVGNATPEIKNIADIILTKPSGSGVKSFVDDLMKDIIPEHKTKPRLLLPFGKKDAKPFYLDPISLLNSNLGIMGSSRSGKSWLAGFMVEQLLKLEYQVCLIDPEGDYHGIRAFSQTILLGGTDTHPLPVGDVVTLIEYSNLSLIIDLSQYSIDQKMAYTADLLRALYSMRKQKGEPHWILLDEAQYFCPRNGNELTDLIVDHMDEGGMGLITYQPSQLSPVVLRKMDHWMITKMKDPDEVELLKDLMNGHLNLVDYQKIESLVGGQAFICVDDMKNRDTKCSGIIEYGKVQRTVPHVRHLHKYLRAPLPESKRFYFHLNGSTQGINAAASLWEFCEVIPRLPVETIQHHIENKDFEYWLGDTINDKELARRVRKLKRRKIRGEMLRQELTALVKERFAELEHLI